MIKYVFSLIFLVVLSSCDEKSEVELDPVPLTGQWELQSASCFCFFEDDFDFGQHKVEFDLENKEITIENSEEANFITGAGTYKIEIDENRFSIKNTLEYSYEIEGSTLTLIYIDDPAIADDEITLTYSKI